MVKSGVLEHKSGNISEMRKDSGKVTGGPIGTHQHSFERYHPDSLRPPLPQDRGFATQPRTAIAIISGMDCKFGRCIQRAHPNKSPSKVLEKRERGRIQGLPKFFEYPLLSQERVKLRTSNFVSIFIGSIETKPIKNFGKSSRGRTQGLSNFSRHPYIGRIARSFLR